MDEALNYNRFVAFLDILGFSRMVESSGPEEIVKKFHLIFSSISNSSAFT